MSEISEYCFDAKWRKPTTPDENNWVCTIRNIGECEKPAFMIEEERSHGACKECYETHILGAQEEPSEGVECAGVSNEGCGGRITHQRRKDAYGYNNPAYSNEICSQCLKEMGKFGKRFVPIPSPPALEPLKEWDESLVGKRFVKMYGGSDQRWPKGEKGVFAKLTTDGMETTWDNPELSDNGFWCNPSRFALAPNQGEPGEKHSPLIKLEGDGAQWGSASKEESQEDVAHPVEEVKEVTHSCKLRFPDNQIVEIPPPTGDGWKREIIFDEWTPGLMNADPVICVNAGNKGIVYLISKQLGFWEEPFLITHEVGKCILTEYRERIWYVHPTVISLVKHARISNGLK